MSVGFCTDFGFCPVGSCSAGGLLPPYLARYIQRKQLTHFLSRQQEFDLRLFGGGCFCFFLDTLSAVSFRAYMIRLITSVLLSLIRSHATFDDLDVISHGGVKKVKLHSH